jgi:PBSX family phage terminase large subunit
MEDNLCLSGDIKRRYEGLYSGVFYDRYIRGLWVVAEGLIYTCFNPALHVVPTAERAYDRYVISCDYGTVNPFSCGLWGRCAGKWYRVAEYYFDSRRERRQQTDAEYYGQLCKLAGNRRIASVIADPSAASFIETIRRGGRFHVEAADNAVLDGIRDVSTRLRQGELFINDCCADCIREFGLYRWDEKSPADKPVKADDHAMDDVRYFVRTVFAPPRYSF